MTIAKQMDYLNPIKFCVPLIFELFIFAALVFAQLDNLDICANNFRALTKLIYLRAQV